MNQQGTVRMELLIDENGSVSEIRNVSGSAGPHLEKTAIDAAQKWSFKPAQKDGVAVRVWKAARIEFKP